jgi:hypothetical protein
VLFVLVGYPVALLLDWRDDTGFPPSGASRAFFAVLWLLACIGTYCWFWFQRQDVSERRRA